MTIIEDFFEKYRIAISLGEFKRYCRSKGYPEPSAFPKDFPSNSWRNVVYALFNRSERKNPFLQRSAGSPSMRRKQYEIPAFNDETRFFYPKGHEEFFWARFIRMAFIYNITKKWIYNYKASPRAAGVLVIKNFYDYYLKGLTIQELMGIIGYTGKSYRGPANIKNNFFEPYVKPLIPKFVWGSPKFKPNEKYSVSELSLLSCELAFEKNFGEGYKALLLKKVIQ